MKKNCTGENSFNLSRIVILFCAFVFSALQGRAQKIDFDNDASKYSPTASGYTQWAALSVGSGGSASKTVDGVTIKISHGSNTVATDINANAYGSGGLSNGAPGNKLIYDGITARGTSGDSKANITSGATSIKLTITGLSVGSHNLLAYHNNVDGWIGKILPDVKVDVNGVYQTSVAQTVRDSDVSVCASTFVKFDVTSTSQSVVITYYTSPVSGTAYATTCFYINSLDFDVTEVSKLAQSPSPSDLNYHADADGTLKLSWTPSVETPSSHIYYFGEDSTAVLNSTSGVSTTDAYFTESNLSPLKKYYWRVDEVISGETYKGKVWSFQPRRDAFPGAEGYGRYAIGGRGGVVYHVTSLDDDATNPAVGTFRYGISKLTGSRTIVFDVGGVIKLKARLTCSSPYVTIAGQTAPGTGVMFRDCPFGMATDGITRFLRLRLGHKKEANDTIILKSVAAQGLDGMGMSGNDNSIMDHCSIGWTIDEAFSSRAAKCITLQNTLISEALDVAGHPNYGKGDEHGYAATIGGGEFGAEGSSFHHNLLAHCEGRNWSMSGALINGVYDGHHDMFNNVVYNWGSRACDGGTHEGQFLNNYYKMGAATTMTYLLNAQLEGTGSGTQAYYVTGNIRENTDGSQTEDAQDVTYKYTLKNNQVLNWTVFQNTPFFEHLATVETAKAAYKNVLSDVGCNEPFFDNHDTRMVTETKNGTHTTTGSYDNVADGLIDSEQDTGCEGFDGLNITTSSRPSGWDTDGDGIPDWFEKAKGWSTSTANNNDCSNSEYYTNLEEYLNWMANPHFIVAGSDTAIILANYFAGYTSPTYTINNSNGNLSVKNNNGTLSLSSSSVGLYSFTVTAAESGISLSRTFNVYIDNNTTKEEDEKVTNDVTVATGGIYGITAKTYSSASGSTWTFSNGFTVSNTQSKTYSTANNDSIKYSASVQYTITIPSGISISGFKIIGYDNYSGTDSYLSELNGTSYSSSDYLFPQKDASGNATAKTFDIDFVSPVTGTLTFTITGRQIAAAIYLTAVGGSSVTLKETATEYTPTAISKAAVTLIRTLNNSYWNTFCVPFDISADVLKQVFGGASVAEFTGTTGSVMNFTAANSIEAGKPYLLKPVNTVQNPVFDNVDIQAKEAETITYNDYKYIGMYVRKRMTYNSNAYQLYLSTSGTLKRPQAYPNNYSLGLRAVMQIPSGEENNAKVSIFDSATGITTVTDDVVNNISKIYNLNGQYVGNSIDKLQRGVYVMNGEKIVVK